MLLKIIFDLERNVKILGRECRACDSVRTTDYSDCPYQLLPHCRLSGGMEIGMKKQYMGIWESVREHCPGALVLDRADVRKIQVLKMVLYRT